MSLPTKSSRLRGLGLRLALWYAAILCVTVLAGGLYLYFRLRSGCLKQADQFLRLWSGDFVSIVQENAEDWKRAVAELRKDTDVPTRGSVVFRLWRPDGTVLAQSRGFPEYPLGDAAQRVQQAVAKKGMLRPWTARPESECPFRLTTEAVRVAGRVAYVVETGYRLRTMCRIIRNYQRNFLRVLVPLVVLGIVGGWWLARKSLAPIADMTAAARAISRESLASRIPVKGTGDELDRLAQVLNEMLDRLQESFERIERFSADLAHEVRTPLTVLKGEAESALVGRLSADELRAVLAEHAEQYERLNSMVADLLLLSRRGAEAAEMECEPVDVCTCVRDAVEMFAPLAEEAGVELRPSPPDAPCRVRGNQSALSRVFSNLLDNALKHTPAGGVISVSVLVDHDVTVTVADTGSGIPPEDLPHVFDRFYRADRSRSRETGGFGLGLSICKQIIEDHHGTIEIQSEPGKGTQVVVHLPRLAEDPGRDDPTPRSS